MTHTQENYDEHDERLALHGQSRPSAGQRRPAGRPAYRRDRYPRPILLGLFTALCVGSDARI